MSVVRRPSSANAAERMAGFGAQLWWSVGRSLHELLVLRVLLQLVDVVARLALASAHAEGKGLLRPSVLMTEVLSFDRNGYPLLEPSATFRQPGGQGGSPTGFCKTDISFTA